MSLIRKAVRAGCALFVILAAGCRGSVSPVPTGAPDVAGRVASYRLQSSSGGLSRLWLDLGPRRAAGLPQTAQIVVDSTTRFVELSDRKVDWALPRIHGAFVRVWFANGLSTPTDVDFVARARLVVVDSLGPAIKDVPFPSEHRATAP